MMEFSYNVWLNAVYSHLPKFTCKPSCEPSCCIFRKSSRTVSGLPATVPSSRYQQLNSESKLSIKDWIVKEKSNGPIGSPYCIPSAEKMILSPKTKFGF